MTFSLYFDQNVLSDLRARKLAETNDPCLNLFKQIILAVDIPVVYSTVTLDEINQIPRDNYKEEHIHLLEELRARYLTPMTKTLSEALPRTVWKNYLENIVDNESSGISRVTNSHEKILRKLSGLQIDETFEELGKELNDGLNDLITGALKNLQSLDINELDESTQEQIRMLKDGFPDLFGKIQHNQPLSIPDGQTLGPKPFLSLDKLQALDVKGLPSNIVVKSIQELFATENAQFDWGKIYGDSVTGKISIAYSLMNWAGYHPDDFDDLSPKRDRFRASSNDMRHAIEASACTFLISSDNAFREKAIASYHYAGVGTTVCSPDEFLKKYC